MKLIKLALAALLVMGTLAPMVSTEAMAYCRACRREKDLQTICAFLNAAIESGEAEIETVLVADGTAFEIPDRIIIKLKDKP